MNFLKSYAHEVVSYHPEKGRDELFAELYNELCEEFADWQVEHPGGDEAAFLDTQKEHPMRFATRLAPEGSAYLIGPQFYYSFISALKIATIVTLGFHLLLGTITAVGSGVGIGTIIRVLVSAMGTLLWVYACIIGVFVALERSGEKATWLDNWTASKLVPSDSHQPISNGETFTDLGISLLALLWLLGIINAPFIVGYDGTWITYLAVNLPDEIWVAVGILLVLDIGYCIVRLVKTFWTPRLRLTSILFNIAWIAWLSYVGAQPDLISASALEAAGIEHLQTILTNVTHGFLYLIIVILTIDTLKHCWKLLRPKQALHLVTHRIDTEG